MRVGDSRYFSTADERIAGSQGNSKSLNSKTVPLEVRIGYGLIRLDPEGGAGKQQQQQQKPHILQRKPH